MKVPALDEGCALFLDFDGTLLSIAPRPQDVRVDDALIGLLGGLQGRLAGALAIVSGRPLRELDVLLAPMVLPAAGQHGVERRTVQGEVHWYAPRAPAAAVRRLTAFAASRPGLILEDKGASLTLHYRLAPHLADAVQREMRALAEEFGPGLQLLTGKKVYELKPVGVDKGVAIRLFMDERPFRGRRPVFVGDDATDEDGFEAVNLLGGHSVKVGAGQSAARFRLRDVSAVHAWLSGSRD